MVAKTQENLKPWQRYSLKGFGFDILLVLGAFLVHFVYGIIAELIGIPQNKWVTFGIMVLLWFFMLARPFAALFFSLLNIGLVTDWSIVLVIVSVWEIFNPTCVQECKKSKIVTK